MSTTQRPREKQQQKKSNYKNKFTPEQKQAYKEKKETEKQE